MVACDLDFLFFVTEKNGTTTCLELKFILQVKQFHSKDQQKDFTIKFDHAVNRRISNHSNLTKAKKVGIRRLTLQKYVKLSTIMNFIATQSSYLFINMITCLLRNKKVSCEKLKVFLVAKTSLTLLVISNANKFCFFCNSQRN